VEFVRVRDHVGWFPLHPRDRHIPWWERRDRQRFDRNVTYVNRTYVTVINQNYFVSARPVHRHIVRDSVIIQEVRAARFTSDSLPIPNRSSLRVLSENGGRRGHRPSDKIVNRAAVVRTLPPAAPRAFQDKLPEIQKNQGKAVEPARILAATQDDRARAPVRVRPAAEANRGGFAPRNPGANAGPAPQPLTEARGKKLASRDESGASNAERTDRVQKTPAPPAQTEPSKGTASRPETPRLERDRDRQREENLTPERQRQVQQQQQEIERKNQAQQKERDRKAQLQKQQQERERQGQEQKQRQLERRQAQQKEEERKAQPQKQPAQERRQELQERQSAQQRLEDLERPQAQQREAERKSQLQQNRQEQERREHVKQQQERQAQQRQQQQEQERKAQAQQQQQEQVRREQLKQQQLQERQERASQQLRREPERAQQLRQQQAQPQREAQQAKRQQEQGRRPQPRQSQQQDRQVQQTPRQPGQL
jgi:hypothetical protein